MEWTMENEMKYRERMLVYTTYFTYFQLNMLGSKILLFKVTIRAK